MTRTALVIFAACALVSCAPGPPAESITAGAFSEDRESALLSVEGWEFDDAPGRILRTRHYRVFTTERDPDLLARLPNFLEVAMEHYRTALAPLPPPTERLDSYLMDNRPQWSRLTLRLLGSAGRAYQKIGRGGFATRGLGVFYDIGPFDTLAIAAHEGWHQYSQRVFEQPLPVWLEEGVACYMEGHRWDGREPIFLPWANLERFDMLRDAASTGRLMSLEQVMATRPQDQLSRTDNAALVWYSQVWALVHFLAHSEAPNRRPALRRAIADASAGRMTPRLVQSLGARGARIAMTTRTGPGVFQAYFGQDMEAASVEYQKFIRNVVARGARDAVVLGRSPLVDEPEG